MKVAAIQALFANNNFASARRIEGIATELRGAGLLPKGGRGPHAPDANEAHAALFALAVAGAERVQDAVSTAITVKKMVDEKGMDVFFALSHAIGDPIMAAMIRRVQVWPFGAEITWRHPGEADHVQRFFEPATWGLEHFDPESCGSTFAGRIGHIGGGVVDQLALKFQEREDEGAGWSGDRQIVETV
ncbi:MAG: hypothetical protein KF780_12310 [Sphingomonas sp.]|nr:hypothetical protein [Sphingomonas sp.]